MTMLKRFASVVKKKEEEKHKMWENDMGLGLGSILVSCLIFSMQNEGKNKFYLQRRYATKVNSIS